jgi:(1->4)-alpha-D-glucan 1-alpha-D-glucosylmutase
MRIPNATYRLQFHQAFSFQEADRIINYLSELGISDIYASPIFKARKGSMHGYDVVDPTQINPELGTQEAFETLIDKLQKKGMGWLQDIVPNHMAYDSQNDFLMDILENGSESEFFDFFDIAWDVTDESFGGKVLAPLLGNLYGDCLENGEIQLTYDEGSLSVNYYDLRLPVTIESYARFITHNLGQLTRSLGRQHPDFIKLLGILYLFKSIPTETKGRERDDRVVFVKSLLWELQVQNSEVKAFLQENIQSFNGEKGNPESFNLLDTLLSEQVYRLCFWKVGAEEINYRRFFTVNELISVKVEELKVFNKTHSLIEKLVSEGKITGVRIDHIDGLYHPTQYLERLREKIGDAYITVEKILELTEELPSQWKIEGTSGYEFLNYVSGIFCDRSKENIFEQIYSRFTGKNLPYEEIMVEKKHLIIEKNLAGDVNNLAQKLKRIASQTRKGSDFTTYGLKEALAEFLAQFPVYRTYIEDSQVSECDRHYIIEAITKTKQHLPRLVKELDFLQALLLREDESYLSEAQKEERQHWIMKFQQMTGPLMAKGVEDTVFYLYNRLLALNEVGGNPSHFGIVPDEFHAFNQKKCQNWLHSMNATATHDTKRGEDARARLNVISEMPEVWEEKVWTWSEINRPYKSLINNKPIPDTNDEYFFYQTLIGVFPFTETEIENEFPEFVERIKNYVIKAVREAKVHTAWLRPDSDYEEGYLSFVEKVLASPEQNQFLQSFLPFQQQIAEYGIYNSLAQVLLKYTAPGVPDLYQGCELWDLSLVDPDNRRPVDYEKRQAFLKEIKTKIDSNILETLATLLSQKEDGKIKLFLTAQLLQARKTEQNLFLKGDYQPLAVTGKYAENIIAFARQYEDKMAIAIAPRLLTRLMQPGELPLGEKWHDTQIEFPPGMPSQWNNAMTKQPYKSDRILAIKEIFEHFPVALLVNE